jgi:hypothetical protein
MNYKEIIQNAGSDELKTFVLNYAETNEKFRSLIEYSLSSSGNPSPMKELINEINYIFTSHGDNGGFIAYRSAPGFERDVNRFFTDTILPLLKNGQTETVSGLLMHLIKKTGSLQIDDSDGCISRIMDEISVAWNTLLAQADKKQTAEYRKWFEVNIENEKIIDYIQDALYGIYFENFTDEESLKSKIRWLDSRTERTQKGETGGSEWTNRFRLETDIKQKIGCMQKLNYSREEIFSLMSAYSDMPEICTLLVDDYCSQKEYDKAEKLLLHLKEKNAMYPGIMCDADNALKKIYRESGQKEKYIQMLQHLLKTDRRNTWNQYLEYKSLFTTSEWRPALHDILAMNLTPELENRIYIEENMIDDLFRSVSARHRKYHSLHELDAYEKYLCPEYEQQIASMYEECLSDEVKLVSNRGQYKELAGYLKKLHKYDNGKEKAAALKQQWMQEYKRRPALMEELKKLKF